MISKRLCQDVEDVSVFLFENKMSCVHFSLESKSAILMDGRNYDKRKLADQDEGWRDLQ